MAQSPVVPRDSARLLEVSEVISDYTINHLKNVVSSNDILVFNDTRVIPAKFIGKRGEAKIEVNLHQFIGEGCWKAFAKPAKRLRIGETFVVAEGFFAEVIEKEDGGEVTLKFNVSGAEFFECLERYGMMPLPPYISRKDGAVEEDSQSYQTVYSKEKGAVAAPTAGLHFTDELFQALDETGVQKAFVTLHVGAGTFLPVKAKNIHEHKMHSEYFEIDQATADKINAVRKKGGRVIAVGTTSLRVLESIADDDGLLHAFSGETDIFITPGYRFKIVDILMTNFHLPKSTLFMLVCAFAGMERMKVAYNHAIKEGYRFFSYGDSSLLYRAE